MRLGLCLVANYEFEHDYIEEFVLYYFCEIGIDVMYLYEDCRTPNEHSLLDNAVVNMYVAFGKIKYIPWYSDQTQAYLDLWNYSNDFDWCMLFDTDEFLMIHDGRTIKEILKNEKFSNATVIWVDWKIYLDNGLLHKTEGGVIARFYNQQNVVEQECVIHKCIIRGGIDAWCFNSRCISHNITINEDMSTIYHINGECIGYCNTHTRQCDYSVAELAHFETKSFEEFIERRSMSRIDNPNITQRNNLMYRYNDTYVYDKDRDVMFWDKYYTLPNIIAVCVITNYSLDKDYIEQYCRYYLEQIGIDRIFLIDDFEGQEHTLDELPYIAELISQDKVIYIQTPHYHQTQIYKNFVRDNWFKYDWCCMFDSDEYLVLHKHNDIHELFSDSDLGFENPLECNVVQVSWLNYGDGGHIHKFDGNVFDTLYREDNKIVLDGVHNKVIIRGGEHQNVYMNLGHNCIFDNDANKIKYIDGKYYEHFDAEYCMLFDNPSYDIAELAHFRIKSLEEFLDRKKNGRFDLPTSLNWTPKNNIRRFIECDCNGVIDLSTQERKQFVENYINKLPNTIALMTHTNYRIDAEYIEEFCRYYLETVKVDKIYLWDDIVGAEHYLYEIPYIQEMIDCGSIIYEQTELHNNNLEFEKFYNDHKFEFDWCCFFDSDEFFVMKVHDDIHDLLADEYYSKYDSIQVTWRIYGDNGYTDKNEGGVMERFYYPSNTHYEYRHAHKVIVRGGNNEIYVPNGGHQIVLNGNYEGAAHIQKFSLGCGDWIEPCGADIYDTAELAHFITKTFEEFIERKKYGRTDMPTKASQLFQFKSFDFFGDYWKKYLTCNEASYEKYNKMICNIRCVCALCVVTNYNLDAEYIEDYCRYYFDTIGIDVIYLYDDIYNNEHTLAELPYISEQISNGRIVYNTTSHHTQMEIYERCYSDYKFQFDWCCFFDSDEYLKLTNHKDIHDLLMDYDLGLYNADVILVNWANYGDNDYLEHQDGNPVDIYGSCEYYIHLNTSKCILQGHKESVFFHSAHIATTKDNQTVKHINGKLDTGYNIFNSSYIDDTNGILVHIATKSCQDYVERKCYGRIDITDEGTQRETFMYFMYQEHNGYFSKCCRWTEQKSIMIEKTAITLSNKKGGQ